MLSAYIHQQFKGQIWKLAIDQNTNFLFAEIRDDESRTASFAGFNLDTGGANFIEITLPEKWLTGMAGCYSGILYLHGYQSAQSPAHKGITALSGETGRVLWANYTDAIHFISVNGPIIYNTLLQPQRHFLLDGAGGKPIRPFDAGSDIAADQDVLIPQIIKHFPVGFEIPEGNTLSGNVHFLEHNSFRIVSLHLLNGGILKQMLLVSKNGMIVYHDLLNEFIQKLQPESFIVYQNKLIYIKNKTALKVLNL